jgi:hypothetical protein
MEDCFTVSGKVRASARGIARAAALGSVLFALLALLSLESIGSGFFVFSLIFLYFLGVCVWQYRQYRILSGVIIMLDADGLLVSYGAREAFYKGEEICLNEGVLPRALGLGKRVQICPAFLLCGRELVVNAESRQRVSRAGAHVLKGRILPLDADAYARLLGSLEKSGWKRPCEEYAGALDTKKEYRQHPLRFVRAAYFGAALLALFAYAVLEDPQLSLVFLLIGLGALGLFVNTFYTRVRLP